MTMLRTGGYQGLRAPLLRPELARDRADERERDWPAVRITLAAVSGIPLRANPAAHAMLRVAFSARPERVETRRTLGADELAEVPQHMRQSVVCEGTTARYRLEVRHGDSLLASTDVRGGGLRHDRRLYVLLVTDDQDARRLRAVRSER